VTGKARRASQAIDQILDAVYDWERAADAFFATGSDDDDVVVTHDSRGALIEVSLRAGLQNDLTVEELETAINDAIAENLTRAQEGLAEISAQFRARCEQISAAVGPHPFGDELVAALVAAGRN
jgi:hypothetical protein